MRKTVFLLLAILLALPVGAHLDGGVDTPVGAFIIDFGYAPAPIIAGEPALLSFNLVNASEEVVSPGSAWVRIANEDVVFAGTFAARADHIVFTYTFPAPGDYEVLVRFPDGPEASFSLRVARQRRTTTIALGVLLALALLAVIKWGMRKRRSRHKI